MKRIIEKLRANWGTLALAAASNMLLAGWIAARLEGYDLPAISCLPMAVCTVCGTAMCVMELLGWADDVRKMGGGEEG